MRSKGAHVVMAAAARAVSSLSARRPGVASQRLNHAGGQGPAVTTLDGTPRRRTVHTCAAVGGGASGATRTAATCAIATTAASRAAVRFSAAPHAQSLHTTAIGGGTRGPLHMVVRLASSEAHQAVVANAAGGVSEEEGKSGSPPALSAQALRLKSMIADKNHLVRAHVVIMAALLQQSR
jgi:hypothetical protein